MEEFVKNICENFFIRRISRDKMNFGSQIVYRNLDLPLNYPLLFVLSEKVHPKPCLFEDLCKCFSTIYITTNIFIRSVSDDTMNFGSQIAYRNLVFSLNYSVLFVSSG